MSALKSAPQRARKVANPTLTKFGRLVAEKFSPAALACLYSVIPRHLCRLPVARPSKNSALRPGQAKWSINWAAIYSAARAGDPEYAPLLAIVGATCQGRNGDKHLYKQWRRQCKKAGVTALDACYEHTARRLGVAAEAAPLRPAAAQPTKRVSTLKVKALKPEVALPAFMMAGVVENNAGEETELSSDDEQRMDDLMAEFSAPPPPPPPLSRSLMALLNEPELILDPFCFELPEGLPSAATLRSTSQLEEDFLAVLLAPPLSPPLSFEGAGVLHI